MTRGGGLATAYLAVWALLGGTALTYLGLLAVRPEMVINGRGAPALADQDSNQNQRYLARFTAALSELKATIGIIERDVGGLKRDAAQRDDQNKAVADRLTALETRVTTIVAAAQPPAAPAARTAARAVDAKPPRAAALVADARPNPIPAPPDLPAGQPEPAKPALETSSIPVDAGTKPPEGGLPGFGVATIVPARAPIGVKLAAGPSVDALRLNWSLLLDRHRGVLAPLEPRYTVGSGGTHELVAGPFKSQADANRVCATLRARGTACVSGRFDGDTL